MTDKRTNTNKGAEIMTIERHFPSGDWIIYEVYQGCLLARRYNGYTKKEAIALFKKERGVQ